jgi:hypothetical protein
MRPPRLISPRPTNSAGKRGSCGKAESSTSTYLGVAMLPSKTGSPPGPSACASDLASCGRGLRNSSAQGSMSVFARSATSSSVTLTEGARSPRLGVITNTPEFSPCGDLLPYGRTSPRALASCRSCCNSQSRMESGAGWRRLLEHDACSITSGVHPATGLLTLTPSRNVLQRSA